MNNRIAISARKVYLVESQYDSYERQKLSNPNKRGCRTDSSLLSPV